MKPMSDELRDMLHNGNVECKCVDCQRCACVGESSVICMDEHDGESWMVIPRECTMSCTHRVRTVRAAAIEALDRLKYIGRDSLNGGLKDVYDILEKSISQEQKYNGASR